MGIEDKGPWCLLVFSKKENVLFAQFTLWTMYKRKIIQHKNR